MSTLDTALSASVNLRKIEGARAGLFQNTQSYNDENLIIRGNCRNSGNLIVANRATIIGSLMNIAGGKLEARKVEYFPDKTHLLLEAKRYILSDGGEGKNAIDAFEILAQYQSAFEPQNAEALSLMVDALLTGKITEAPDSKILNILQEAFRHIGNPARLKDKFVTIMSRSDFGAGTRLGQDILEKMIKFLEESVEEQEMSATF